jgi:BTB/POZ domain
LLTLKRKFQGPKVDIYVGPEAKHYSVPKDVLCYYSSYFNSCFNGSFKEAQEQKLSLPEDNVENFEVLMYYVLTGHVAPQIPIGSDLKEGMETCMNLIEYADKYGLAEASMAVEESLTKILKRTHGDFILPNHIEIIYRAFQHPHILRQTFAAHAAHKCLCGAKFAKQEDEVRGFARDIVKYVREKGSAGLVARSVVHHPREISYSPATMYENRYSSQTPYVNAYFEGMAHIGDDQLWSGPSRTQLCAGFQAPGFLRGFTAPISQPAAPLRLASEITGDPGDGLDEQ